MITFAQWRALVVTAYQGGNTTHSQQMRMVADGARSITVRDVESDLALSKSYLNSFKAALVEAAATPMDSNLAATIAEVRGLMPIDADTPAINNIVNNAIEMAFDNVNDMSSRFDALLIQAAIDLQRHVPFFQVRQISTFIEGGSGVTNDGFISRVALPDTARIQQVWFGHYYADLEADTEYESGDRLTSNGRVYEVIAAGQVTEEEVETGLTSTDGETETLGNMTFQYRVGEREFPVRQIDWMKRNLLRAGEASAGPMYAFPPQCDELWLYPALDDKHRFDLEWVGVAEEFEDTDNVLFDRTAAEAAAHYIRSMLLQSDLNDLGGAGASNALFQRALRKAVIDNQDRDQGMPGSSAPYDWRSRRWCGSFCGTSTPIQGQINDYFLLTNGTGGTNLIGNTARNMTVEINFTGTASTRTIAPRLNNYQRGDRLTIVATLPGVPGLVLDFRNGSAAGAQLLPTETFPDGVFTTDAYILSATFNFVFSGTAWEYDESSIPS